MKGVCRWGCGLADHLLSLRAGTFVEAADWLSSYVGKKHPDCINYLDEHPQSVESRSVAPAAVVVGPPVDIVDGGGHS